MADFEEALNNLLADPEAMGQIMALANSLGGGDGGPGETAPPPEGEVAPAAPISPLPFQDLGKMARILEVLQAPQGRNQEAEALLGALRPFLRPERQRTLDRALRAAGLSQAARRALSLWREGGLDV